TRHTMVHEQLASFFSGFRRDAHPMAIMCGVVGALSAFYHDSTDINDPVQREIASHRLVAKLPTIAAMAYKYSSGQPFVYPPNKLGYTENFLRMTFSVPAEEYVVNPVLAKALVTILILHADTLLKVAIELERIALQDEYFIEKKLYPNIDFYSGITLRALGFPTSMFTALFALARTVGWIAQWKEMLEDPHQKIGRPRQI